MKLKRLVLPLVLVALSACDSGDININPSTADNSTDNSVTNSNNTTAAPVAEENPCASYVNSGGQTIEDVPAAEPVGVSTAVFEPSPQHSWSERLHRNQRLLHRARFT